MKPRSALLPAKWPFLLVSIAAPLTLCGLCSLVNLLARIPPAPATNAVALADLDGDGDLDAFLANGQSEHPQANTVLWNNGDGRFRDSGQLIGEAESRGVLLHDLDEDGDADALVSNTSWGEIFWNDGRGSFARKQFLEVPHNDGFFVGIWRYYAAELNGDGESDLFLAGCCGGGVSEGPDQWRTLNAFNTVLIHGGGWFDEMVGARFGRGSTQAAALADLDGDGDLDAFGANSLTMDDKGKPLDDVNSVWFNDGRGFFVDSGQRLGNQRTYAAAAGDLDGDGDDDIFAGNKGPDDLWWNDGQGHFAAGDQGLGNSPTKYLHLADVDSDGDLDALTGDDTSGRLWLNDGRGIFDDSGQTFSYSSHHAVAFGDVNGDGAIDVVAARLDSALVWLNNGQGQLNP